MEKKAIQKIRQIKEEIEQKKDRGPAMPKGRGT